MNVLPMAIINLQRLFLKLLNGLIEVGIEGGLVPDISAYLKPLPEEKFMSEEHVTERQKEVIQSYMEANFDLEIVGSSSAKKPSEEWSIGTSRRLKADAISQLDDLADRTGRDASMLREIADQMRRGII